MLIAPMTADALRLVADGRDVIIGAGAHHAIASREPGDTDWAEPLAQRLSSSHAGTFWAYLVYSDYEWLTEVVGGEIVKSDEGAIDLAALGLSWGAPPVEPRRYLLAVGVTPDDVARALGGKPAPRRHLVSVRIGTLGWTDGADLGFLAARVSAALSCRTYAVVDEGHSLRVRVHESGEEKGRYERKPSDWSEGLRLTEIEGASSPDEVRAALELPSR